MDEQRWHTINQILDTALSLEEKTRSDYVRESCGDDAALADEILAMLNELPESEAFWEAGKKRSETLLRDYSKNLFHRESSDTSFPFRIGKYEAIEIIGQGGMGTVYKARRIDGEFERSVAIKVVNELFVSDSIVERFRRERQILAQLNHPNIAVLYDGGISEDGRPYLVMELINGKPITEYGFDHKLSLSERIELLKKLCLTVHYAHQNLIVHRDLKPSNILVNEAGELKVLDFGIARLLEESVDEESENRILSLQYASPEQIRNQKITTSSDIYNLGLIGYELFHHHKPFDFSGLNRAEAEEIIENKLPANVPANFPSDLQAIIRKTLEKDPESRYSSALEFHQDLDDFQQKKPVKAVPGNYRYKTLRFLTRNIKAISAAVVFILTLSTLLFYHIQTVSEERDKALEEAKKAQITSAFMSGIFKSADYTRDDETAISSSRFLDNGVEYIHRDLGHYPDVQARLLETIAQIHQNLGHLGKAEALYLESASIREELPADHPEKYLLSSCYHNLGSIYRDLGNYSKSEQYFISALRMEEKNESIEPLNLTNTMTELGWIWYTRGQYAKADSIFSVSKEILEKEQLQETIVYSNTIHNLGWVFFEKGDYNKSENLFSRSLSLRKHLYDIKAYDAATIRIAQSLQSLGWVLYTKGNLDSAAYFTEEAITIRDSTFGRNHSETAWVINNLGLIEQSRNNLEKAEGLISEAYGIRKDQLGENHPLTIQSLGNIAIIAFRRGEYDKAISIFKKVLDLNQGIYQAPHSTLVNDLGNLGAAYQAAEQLPEAYETLKKAYEMALQVYPHNHPLTSRISDRLSQIKGILGK